VLSLLPQRGRTLVDRINQKKTTELQSSETKKDKILKAEEKVNDRETKRKKEGEIGGQRSEIGDGRLMSGWHCNKRSNGGNEYLVLILS
jgi:hypothetical protein